MATKKPVRNIIQIAAAEKHIYALCNDSTVWVLDQTNRWIPTGGHNVPQPDDDKKKT